MEETFLKVFLGDTSTAVVSIYTRLTEKEVQIEHSGIKTNNVTRKWNIWHPFQSIYSFKRYSHPDVFGQLNQRSQDDIVSRLYKTVN